jgi:hypothetical protein
MNDRDRSAPRGETLDRAATNEVVRFFKALSTGSDKSRKESLYDGDLLPQ